ncbi:hypothetical protein AJ78_04367 [Emergomyces pasteurianus Ep9510]|uniref:Zn(2)-C6 fungal-type domain-containing protein n=1 Tax=Emergomyces pasteurianus Ep9510 TaxID=1447872 RepID=A0A1J9PHH8_9EURO|nr:hypothetical protein AJ78_04367 [Emergomyces pasteurianus Ep9510]
MSEAHTCCAPYETGETPVLPKKRKVRKGTQSCWECKRRKIRCTFAAPTETICDGCRSRQTKCISQEFYQEKSFPSRPIGRLSGVEYPVEKVVKKSDTDVLSMLHPGHVRQNESTESTVRVNAIVGDALHLQRKTSVSRGDNCCTNSGLNPITKPGLKLQAESGLIGSFDEISRSLIAVWPDQHDLDLILSVLVSVSASYHGVVCIPYSKFLLNEVSSPQRLLQLPPHGSHPVLIARRLLLLGSFIQSIPLCSLGKLVGMKSDYRAIMSQVVRTASRLVTSDDELVSSLDGIECVMIESMYLNNAGNLRRAWLTNRRAMVVAQMMGLHRGMYCSSMSLEEGTRDRIDPDYMWFRIVLTDRYLSLMLGLPQGSAENVFASPAGLQRCMAIERMERLLCVAAGLILQRNSTERTDLAATFRVDGMLREAASLMPPQWWLINPDPTTLTSNNANAFEESIRLTSQFAHHHLLVQLHLPYMMTSSSVDTSYDYCKITAANASRTIISQFVAFRQSNVTTAYCRGIDFVAFTASITLCLAHMEARRQHKDDSNKGISVFQSLQHQRLSDRGLLERTLEIMKSTARKSHDIVAQTISNILQPLLAIENNSADGHGSYHTRVTLEPDKHESQIPSDRGGNFEELLIHIPYFGTVKIEHHSILPDIVTSTTVASEDSLRRVSISQETNNSPVVSCRSISPVNQARLRTHEKEMIAPTRLTSDEIIAIQPASSSWQAEPLELNPPHPLELTTQSRWEDLAYFNSTERQTNNLILPNSDEDIEYWALQGVDFALFSNLLSRPRGQTPAGAPHSL